MKIRQFENERDENIDMVLDLDIPGYVGITVVRDGVLDYTITLTPVEAMSLEMMLSEARSDILNHGIREFLKK